MISEYRRRQVAGMKWWLRRHVAFRGHYCPIVCEPMSNDLYLKLLRMLVPRAVTLPVEQIEGSTN